MTEKIQTVKVIAQGGLKTNQNYLDMSDNAPGAATALVNFEPSLYGGYRRINGYIPLEEEAPEIDPDNAEGKVLGVFIYNGDVIACRKQQGLDEYKFYRWVSGGAWDDYVTGLTHSTVGIDKVRAATFNFDGDPKIVFVDGVNNATLFDGTTWVTIDSADSGADYANAGGNQAIDAPRYVTVFKNHIFLAGDPSAPGVVAHSAPGAEYDWTAASGAGQIAAGLPVVQIKPWRDQNYVFGLEGIKYITVEGTDFVIKDVTQNIGCVASDSVQEVGGDLVFLAQDGVRPISGTARIGDVELETISKDIQTDVTALISSFESTEINSVVVRRKSQIRFFFGGENVEVPNAQGLIGGLKGASQGIYWEWAKTLGIRVSCTVSGYVDTQEFVLHGDHDGCVYRQEQGRSFNGSDIFCLYRMPYLDFGDTEVRKTFRQVNLFIRPEGPLSLTTQLIYDWGLPDRQNPQVYINEEVQVFSIYGNTAPPDAGGGSETPAIYGESIYAVPSIPVKFQNVQGSANSIQVSFTNTNASPFTIQGVIFEFSVDGRQ